MNKFTNFGKFIETYEFMKKEKESEKTKKMRSTFQKQKIKMREKPMKK